MKNTKLKYNADPVGVAVIGDPKKGETKFIANPVGAGLVPAQNEKGITLIALIITIIVMLILVGVTINVALNGGLFKKADDAAKLTQTEIEKEQLMNSALAVFDPYTGVDFSNLKLPENFTGENGKYTSTKSGKTYTINKTTAEINEYKENTKDGYSFTIADLMEMGGIDDTDNNELMSNLDIYGVIVPYDNFWDGYNGSNKEEIQNSQTNNGDIYRVYNNISSSSKDLYAIIDFGQAEMPDGVAGGFSMYEISNEDMTIHYFVLQFVLHNGNNFNSNEKFEEFRNAYCNDVIFTIYAD